MSILYLVLLMGGITFKGLGLLQKKTPVGGPVR